jgi:membrane protease YdiL (CAAX protease family)
MKSKTIYKPAAFFLITMLISWSITFIAIYFSYQKGMEEPVFLLFLAAACGPFVTALIMHYRAKSPELWRDYWDRLVNPKRIKPATVPVILLLMPFAMVVSILISLGFGKSADQFTLTPQGSFSMGVPVMFIMVLIPTLEEMGWKGYGVDSLRSRFNLFKTSLWFGALWALWHAPMFFIKNTYMNGLLLNWVYTANFFVSVFPVGFIINWLFYKNNRSIMACALFHISVDISAEIFAVEKFTKCIDTAVWILVVGMIMFADRKLFFEEKVPV